MDHAHSKPIVIYVIDNDWVRKNTGKHFHLNHGKMHQHLCPSPHSMRKYANDFSCDFNRAQGIIFACYQQWWSTHFLYQDEVLNNFFLFLDEHKCWKCRHCFGSVFFCICINVIPVLHIIWFYDSKWLQFRGFNSNDTTQSLYTL